LESAEMIYVSDKIIFSDGRCLYDCLNNKVAHTCDDVNGNSYIVASTFNNQDVEFYGMLEHENYSMLLDVNNKLTFKKHSNSLLQNLQCIEMLIFQNILGRSITIKDSLLWDELTKIDYSVRDGRINSNQYTELVNSFKSLDSQTVNALTIYNNIRHLDEIILDELHHAEFRFIDCINSQIKNVYEYEIKNDFVNNKESIFYTTYSDNAGWCIQDSIKSLSKSLDVISKLNHYLKDINKIQIKIPSKYFSDIKYAIENWTNIEAKKSLKEAVDQLGLLTLLRNEFTHNTSLTTSRQPVYVGKGTSCINFIPLVYSDILFWDHNGKNYDRANNKIGFFSRQLNALSQIHFFYNKTVEILNYSIMQLLENAKNVLLEKGIVYPLIWKFNELLNRDELCQVELNNLNIGF
jgi:hypothetical protein